jgi:hypothetical protein
MLKKLETRLKREKGELRSVVENNMKTLEHMIKFKYYETIHLELS